MKYYALVIWGDVEPFLSDPFDTEEERDKYARTVREQDPEQKHGIYKIETNCEEPITIDSYAGFELEINDDEEQDNG